MEEKPTNARAERGPVAPLAPVSAALLVAYTSGAILVLEILSLRLVAPYVGLTLQMSTAVIGFALAAISTGAWVGGRVADRVPPERLIGPTVLIAGALVLLVGPAVRWTGEAVGGGDLSAVLLITAVAVFVPAALLAAVTPMVVKLRLSSLAETGTIVGRLSGIATLGALIATFATGFLLVAAAPTSVILLALGASLIVTGMWLTLRQRAKGWPAVSLLAAAVGVSANLAVGSPCETETAYHCARVLDGEGRASGRVLHLDTLRHSYVDLDDPTYLHFGYIGGIASIADVIVPDPDVRALHLGGGGLTLPRYLAATRSGSGNLVIEIDPGVIDLGIRRLGGPLPEQVEVQIQDARVGLAEEPSDERDVVVGDAFAGLTVPWHLTTRETVSDVRRVSTQTVSMSST